MKTFSRSEDIVKNPSIALPKSITELLIVFSNLLNLISSWCNTVFMDSVYSTLCVFLTKSMSNDLGNLAKISLHLSL